jgi:PHD/YefM family antitoxin component YafN of YafNO toxin-antitoxin module
MPIVETHPHIDPTVRHVGVSKLRALNADKLRDTETLVIQENDKPLAVLLTYEKFIAMQEELLAVARTVEMFRDTTEVEAFKAGLADMTAGRHQTLDEIDAEIKGAKKTRG